MDAQDFFTDGHGFLMVQDSLTGFAPLLANAAEIVQAGGNAETAAAFLWLPTDANAIFRFASAASYFLAVY